MALGRDDLVLLLISLAGLIFICVGLQALLGPSEGAAAAVDPERRQVRG